MADQPFAPWCSWTRLWDLPAACSEATMNMVETMTVAPLVIQARLPALQAGLAFPWSADNRELRRMVTEKVVAWGEACTIAHRDMVALMPTVGSDPTRLFADGIRIFDLFWRMPGRSHRPIHRAVLANHRRLSRRGIRRA